MAKGGAYENPAMIGGSQSGRIWGQTAANIGESVARGITQKQQRDDELAERKRQEAEKARIRAEENWRIYKTVESQRTQDVINFQNTVKENQVLTSDLDTSFNSVIDELTEARKRYNTSRGDYPGRAEDEAIIKNNTAFIQGLGENFKSMNMLTSTWKELYKSRNTPGGIDDSATDPLFAAMMQIGEGDGKGINSGTVGWTTKTGPNGEKQLFQVARSEEIRRLNIRNKLIETGLTGDYLNDAVELTYTNEKDKYSDTYELSYDQVHSFLTDDDNNPDTFGPFSLVPNNSDQIKKDAKKAGVLNEGGSLTAGDITKNETSYLKKGEEKSNRDDIGIYTSQKTWPDTEQIYAALSNYAKSDADADLGFGSSSTTANATIRANALTRDITIDGKKGTEYYVPIYERGPEGERKISDTIVLGNSIDGLLTQGYEDGTEKYHGYSKEEFDNYVKLSEYMYSRDVGSFQPAVDIAPTKREYSVKFPVSSSSDGGGDSSKLNKNETIIYDRLTKGYQGFADFFEENTTNKTGEMSEDGLIFTFKDENRKKQTIDMTDEQQVIGLFKLMLDQEKGLGTAKAKDAAIFRLVEKYRKDKFGSSETNTSEGEGKGEGSLNNL